MAQYKYKVENIDSGYIFVLYPNNSNTQPIGQSVKVANSYKACLEQLNDFKNFVKSSNIKKCLMIDSSVKGKWYPSLVKEDTKIFERKAAYTQGAFECQDWCERIIENIDSRITD